MTYRVVDISTLLKNIDIDINIDKDNIENIDINIDIEKTILKDIDIAIDIDKDNLGNINIDIDIENDFLENIDIDIEIDKGILQNIDIYKISYRLEFGISNRANCRITSLQKNCMVKNIHIIVEISGYVTDAGQTNERPKSLNKAACLSSYWSNCTNFKIFTVSPISPFLNTIFQFYSVPSLPSIRHPPHQPVGQTQLVPDRAVTLILVHHPLK